MNYSNNTILHKNNIWKTPKEKMPVLSGDKKKLMKKNEKSSVGIACCRIKNNKPGILLVQKRYTYAFCEFVHGQYITEIVKDTHNNKVSTEFSLSINNTNVKDIHSDTNILIIKNPVLSSYQYDNNELKKKLSMMTLEEKLDILTFDFDKLWYRIWLDSPKIPQYYISKLKFEFLDKSKLKKMIEHSKNIGLLWEIPKGMKKKGETDINAAVREFEEETNIAKMMYKINPDAKIKYKYIDDLITYNVQYYIAITKKNIIPEINLSSKEQIKEISAIKWFTIEEIRFVDDKNKHLEQIVSRAFKQIK